MSTRRLGDNFDMLKRQMLPPALPSRYKAAYKPVRGGGLMRIWEENLWATDRSLVDERFHELHAAAERGRPVGGGEWV